MGNPHGLEEQARDLTHQDMLGLVLEARLTAPSDNKQGRDPEWEVERRQRIHRIAEPRVLAHDHRLSPGQPSASGDGHCFAFARCSDIIEQAVADNPVDQWCEKAARHAGIEGETMLARWTQEIICRDHWMSRSFGGSAGSQLSRRRAALFPREFQRTLAAMIHRYA